VRLAENGSGLPPCSFRWYWRYDCWSIAYVIMDDDVLETIRFDILIQIQDL